MSHLAGWTTSPAAATRRSCEQLEAARPGGRRLGLLQASPAWAHGLPDNRSRCMASDTKAGVRLDKWLWAARFFKTRSLAAKRSRAAASSANGQVAKASREVRPGDTPRPCARERLARTVVVLRLSALRAARRRSPRRSTRRRRRASPPARPPPRRAPPDARAGGGASSTAARPSATAASSPTGIAGAPRSTPTEEIQRRRELPLEMRGDAPQVRSDDRRTTSPPPRGRPGRRRRPGLEPAANASRRQRSADSTRPRAPARPTSRPATPSCPTPTCGPRPRPRTPAAAPRRKWPRRASSRSRASPRACCR